MSKTTNKEKDFVPVYAYAEQHNVSRQNIYRWIRERKFDEGDVQVIEKVVTRIKIKKDATPRLQRKP
jgi:hypothetical protein